VGIGGSEKQVRPRVPGTRNVRGERATGAVMRDNLKEEVRIEPESEEVGGARRGDPARRVRGEKDRNSMEVGEAAKGGLGRNPHSL